MTIIEHQLHFFVKQEIYPGYFVTKNTNISAQMVLLFIYLFEHIMVLC